MSTDINITITNEQFLIGKIKCNSEYKIFEKYAQIWQNCPVLQFSETNIIFF